MSKDTARQETVVERAENECPECGTEGIPNPVLDDWYECPRCVISFNTDGEVETGE